MRDIFVKLEILKRSAHEDAGGNYDLRFLFQPARIETTAEPSLEIFDLWLRVKESIHNIPEVRGIK
jgi:hypothetical protein